MQITPLFNNYTKKKKIEGIQSGFTIFAENLNNQSGKPFSPSEINPAHTVDKEEYKWKGKKVLLTKNLVAKDYNLH